MALGKTSKLAGKTSKHGERGRAPTPFIFSVSPGTGAAAQDDGDGGGNGDGNGGGLVAMSTASTARLEEKLDSLLRKLDEAQTSTSRTPDSKRSAASAFKHP